MSTSSTAQEVTAVKECMLPPVVGYNIDVSQYGALKTASDFNFASLTVKKRCVSAG